jgi:hypothetical protein
LTVFKLPEGLGHIELALKRAATTDMDLWGCLFAMRRFWSRRSVLYLTKLQSLISSCHIQRLLHCHLYCWTLKMMIQMTCP